MLITSHFVMPEAVNFYFTRQGARLLYAANQMLHQWIHVYLFFLKTKSNSYSNDLSKDC